MNKGNYSRHGLSPQLVSTLTDSFEGIAQGNLDVVIEQMYESLRMLARRRLAGDRAGHTLSATALVNEAYLRLEASFPDIPRSRQKFMAIASRLMRQVLVDHARARNRDKRGGGIVLDTYTDSIQPASEAKPENLLQVDLLLDQLESRNPLHCRIVECRFFAGMSIVETADALDTSASSVKRGWRFARAWLYNELGGEAELTRS